MDSRSRVSHGGGGRGLSAGGKGQRGHGGAGEGGETTDHGGAPSMEVGGAADSRRDRCAGQYRLGLALVSGRPVRALWSREE